MMNNQVAMQRNPDIISNSTNIFGSVLVGILVVALFFPILQRSASHNNDYKAHSRIAEKMLETGQIDTPHPLYQLLVLTVHALIPGVDLLTCGFIVTLTFYMMSGVAVYFLIGNALGSPRSSKAMLCHVFLSLLLLLVNPITILAFIDRLFYHGYITINVYHNPTIVVLKPIAVLLFMYSVKVFTLHVEPRRKIELFLAFILTILSLLAKPSFTISLLPALLLLVTHSYIRNRPVNWKLMISGVLVPAIVLLAWQYYFTYASGEHASRIRFVPFGVVRSHSAWILEKFVLSVIFPATVYLLYYRYAIRDVVLNFSWLIFIIGAIYGYFLAESGDEFRHGNFFWSAQISLFILFVASSVFFVRQEMSLIVTFNNSLRSSKRAVACMTVFGLHLASGVYWYYGHLIPPPLYR